MKFPEHVFFRKELSLIVWKPRGVLGEAVVNDVIAFARNEMGGAFRLVKAVYALDGVQILSKADDSGRLSEMKDFDVYNGAIQPGSHTLTVQLVYQGNGFGVFSYLKGYKFTVRSSHTFVAVRCTQPSGRTRVRRCEPFVRGDNTSATCRASRPRGRRRAHRRSALRRARLRRRWARAT